MSIVIVRRVGKLYSVGNSGSWRMGIFSISRLTMIALIVLGGFTFAHAQADTDYTPELLRTYFVHKAKLFEFTVEGRESSPILRADPILNWQNAEREGQWGSAFVCTDEGRPAIIFSQFTFMSKNGLRHRYELISMLDRPMKVTHDGERVWKPKAADTKGSEVSEVGVPDSAAARRLNQMRSIMRQMEGQVFTEPPSKLNLLPQPLFRYDSPSKGIIDGAIFALALGTDPDILVAIEARSSEDGAHWYMFPLRSHFLGLELKYRGDVVWKAEPQLSLQSSGPMQMPDAVESFFVYSAAESLPSPAQMKRLTESDSAQ